MMKRRRCDDARDGDQLRRRRSAETSSKIERSLVGIATPFQMRRLSALRTRDAIRVAIGLDRYPRRRTFRIRNHPAVRWPKCHRTWLSMSAIDGHRNGP